MRSGAPTPIPANAFRPKFPVFDHYRYLNAFKVGAITGDGNPVQFSGMTLEVIIGQVVFAGFILTISLINPACSRLKNQIWRCAGILYSTIIREKGVIKNRGMIR